MFGRKRLLQLERENGELRDALQWYAEERHWRRKKTNAKGEPRQWVKSPASNDRGDRARTVLYRFPGEPPPTWVDRLLDWLCGPEDQPVPWRARPAHPKRRASDAPATTPMAGRVDDLQWPVGITTLRSAGEHAANQRATGVLRALGGEDTE